MMLVISTSFRVNVGDVLIVYDSRENHTFVMANSIANGIKAHGGSGRLSFFFLNSLFETQKNTHTIVTYSQSKIVRERDVTRRA